MKRRLSSFYRLPRNISTNWNGSKIWQTEDGCPRTKRV
jgi:hypothetical protein